jgi:hypothetical protein
MSDVVGEVQPRADEAPTANCTASRGSVLGGGDRTGAQSDLRADSDFLALSHSRTHSSNAAGEITNPGSDSHALLRGNPGHTSHELNHRSTTRVCTPATAPRTCRTLTCPNHHRRRRAPHGERLSQTAPSSHETRPAGLGLTCGFTGGRCWVRTNVGLADGFTVQTILAQVGPPPVTCVSACGLDRWLRPIPHMSHAVKICTQRSWTVSLGIVQRDQSELGGADQRLSRVASTGRR